MKQLRTLLICTTGLLMLAACNVVIVFNPVATPVTASTSDSPVANATLASGDTMFFKVTISASVAGSGNVLYYELDAGRDKQDDSAGVLELRVLDNGGLAVASSNSNSFFGPGISVAAASSGLTSSGISSQRKCLGACVIESSFAGTRFLRVHNASAGSVSFDLFAYSFGLQDTGEPANDSSATATALTGFDKGAIETLGDQDYYRATKSGTLSFNSSSAIALRVELVADGTKLAPGSSTTVSAGEILRVFASDGRAGSPSASFYTLDIQ